MNDSNLYYLVTRPCAWTLSNYFKTYGQALQKHLRVIPYESLFGVRRFGSGLYIFSDVERLTDLTTDLAVQLWERLDKAGKGVVVLNHPLRSMRRYELLRNLHDSGVNQFNVYWLRDEVLPKRFPVFIRDESKHAYFYSSVLKTPDELSAAAAKIRRDREKFKNSIVVEFCDTRDANGVFRKYSAFVVGGRIGPRHIYFSRHWDVRQVHEITEWTEPMYREVDQYLQQNPDESFLKEIFRTAGIQYGRVDYSFLNGRPQVWEINTHPYTFAPADYPPARLLQTELSARDFTAALQDLLVEPKEAVNLTVFFRIRKAAYWREIFDSALRMAWDFLKGLFPRHVRLAVRDRLTAIPGLKRFRRHE